MASYGYARVSSLDQDLTIQRAALKAADPSGLLYQLPSTKLKPDIIQLATQLTERQTGTYDPTDVEDRSETRLRAVIETTLKGEGIKAIEEAQPDRGD